MTTISPLKLFAASGLSDNADAFSVAGLLWLLSTFVMTGIVAGIVFQRFGELLAGDRRVSIVQLLVFTSLCAVVLLLWTNLLVWSRTP